MKSLIFRVAWWVLIGWLWVQPAYAGNPADTVIVNALAEQWMIYNKQQQAYVPYLHKIHREANKLYLIIDPRQHRGLFLTLYGHQGAHLFINNQLRHSFEQSAWLHLSMDSLGSYKTLPFVLAYYESSPLKEAPEAYITQGRYSRERVKPAEESNPAAKTRKIYPYREVMILISLLLLSIMSLMSRLIKPVFSISFVVRGLDAFLQGKNQIKRLQALNFLVFLLYYGFTLAFTILFLDTYVGSVTYEGMNTDLSAGQGLRRFFVIFLTIVVIVCLKYLTILLMSKLYNDRYIANVHFQEYMSLSQIFCTVILVVVILACSVSTELPGNYLEGVFYFFITCLLAKAILMSYRLNKFTSYKKTYLFSYLCTTEYMPLLLSAKIFLIL